MKRQTYTLGNIKLSFGWPEVAIVLVLTGCMLYLQENMGCSVKIGDNWLYGNCGELRELTSSKLEKIMETQILDYQDPNVYDYYQMEEKPIIRDNDSFEIEFKPTTTTITCPTTTTTLEKKCPTCPTSKCECEICTKCPTCSFELNKKQIDWFLNDCRPKNSESACKQAGEAEACQRVMEYLKVPGRPKFKMTPSVGVGDYYRNSRKTDNNKFCFKDLGGYFILNRTPDQNNRTRWGWNDDNCIKSSLRVNDL